MRGHFAAVPAVLAVQGASFAQAGDLEISTQAGVDALVWEDDLGDSATQLAAEVRGAAVWRDFGAALSTGWVTTEYTSDVDALNGDVSTPLDTRLLLEWTPGAFDIQSLPVTVSADLDLNAPTGQNQLAGAEKNAALDPLLSIYDRFGEGFNAGAGAFISVEPMEGLALGFGLKHAWTGEYEPDGDAPETVLDPADITALNVQATWSGPAVIATLGAQVYDPGVVTRNGENLFDQALTTELNGGAVLKLSPTLQLQAGGFYSTRGADTRLNEITGAFVEEEERLNGDVWGADLTLSRLQAPLGEVRVLAAYVNAGASEFEDTLFEYRPERDRYEIGVGLYRDLGPAAIDLELVYFRWTDKGSALLTELAADGLRFGISLERTW